MIVYLFVRAIPRIEEHPVREAVERQAGIITRFFKNLPVEKLDQWVSKFLEKFLRKTKVVVLKVDNKVTMFLERVRAIQKRERLDPEIHPQRDRHYDQLLH